MGSSLTSSPSCITSGRQILTRALMNQFPTCALVIPLAAAILSLSRSSGYGESKCATSQSLSDCVRFDCELNLNPPFIDASSSTASSSSSSSSSDASSEASRDTAVVVAAALTRATARGFASAARFLIVAGDGRRPRRGFPSARGRGFRTTPGQYRGGSGAEGRSIRANVGVKLKGVS
eukprot:31477-Pelagococcus_subviridis.AAC.4